MTLPPKIHVRPFLLKFDENLHNCIHVDVLSSVRKETRAKNEKLFTVNVT